MENKIIISKKAGKIFIVGATVGIGGGLFLMAAGLIFGAISYFDRITFRGPDVASIVAGFIFLAVGMHFLDLMEEEKKTKRIEYCRENGLKNEGWQEITVTDERLK